MLQLIDGGTLEKKNWMEYTDSLYRCCSLCYVLLIAHARTMEKFESCVIALKIQPKICKIFNTNIGFSLSSASFFAILNKSDVLIQYLEQLQKVKEFV